MAAPQLPSCRGNSGWSKVCRGGWEGDGADSCKAERKASVGVAVPALPELLVALTPSPGSEEWAL